MKHWKPDGQLPLVLIMPAPFLAHWYCALHDPLNSTPPEVQLAPWPATSSVMPLQSSSRPLHTSVVLVAPPMQACTPFMHTYMPSAQMPPPMQSALLPV